MNVRTIAASVAVACLLWAPARAQRYSGADGKLRVALAKQPFSPNGTSPGPTTMAKGGIQQKLADLGATFASTKPRSRPTRTPSTAAGSGSAWRSATSPTSSSKNERDGYFTVGLLRDLSVDARAWSPGCSTRDRRASRSAIGMLWLDAHPDFNTPETTRSGSLGGMPVAVATGRALQRHAARRAARSAARRSHVVMGGVRLTDPLEQQLLDESAIEQLTVDDLRHATPAVFAQLDRLNRHHRQDLRPHRHGRARSARGHGAPEQGAERPVERAAGRAVRADLQPLSEGVGDRLRDDSVDGRRRARRSPR